MNDNELQYNEPETVWHFAGW